MRGHLSIEELTGIKEGRLSVDEKLAVLTHIGECDRCAEALADCYEENQLLVTSPDFSQRVYEKIERSQRKEREEIRLRYGGKGTKTDRKGQKGQLYAYAFKVSVAACVTFILLFSGTFGNSMNWVNKGISDRNDWAGITKITQSVRNVSERLFPSNPLDGTKEEKR